MLDAGGGGAAQARERLGVSAPGEYKKLGLDGVDAHEVIERMWQARPPCRDELRPEWFCPTKLVTRLYELRGREALAVATAVEAFLPHSRYLDPRQS